MGEQLRIIEKDVNPLDVKEKSINLDEDEFKEMHFLSVQFFQHQSLIIALNGIN